MRGGINGQLETMSLLLENESYRQVKKQRRFNTFNALSALETRWEQVKEKNNEQIH